MLNIDVGIISSVIDKLAPKTKCGLMDLLLKAALLRPITVIINQMINNVIFPDKLKIGKIIPIQKIEDESLLTNYRPISLLPAISKVFEKVMTKQLYQSFQEKKHVLQCTIWI